MGRGERWGRWGQIRGRLNSDSRNMTGNTTGPRSYYQELAANQGGKRQCVRVTRGVFQTEGGGGRPNKCAGGAGLALTRRLVRALAELHPPPSGLCLGPSMPSPPVAHLIEPGTTAGRAGREGPRGEALEPRAGVVSHHTWWERMGYQPCCSTRAVSQSASWADDAMRASTRDFDIRYRPL